MGRKHYFIGSIALALASCSDEPQGQVVANVDGQEVTRRELMAELNAGGYGAAGDRKARAAALEAVIDRKLLVRAARDALIDQQPAFQAEALRQRELALVHLLLRRTAEGVAPPTPNEVAAHRAAHPWRYERREAMLLERADPAASGSTSVVDSASLSSSTAERLAAAPVGTPVSVVEEGRAMTLTVRQRWPVATSLAAQTSQAATDLRALRVLAAERQMIAKLRRASQIRRQPPED